MVEAWQQSEESLASFARCYGVDGQRVTGWASRLAPSAADGVRFHPVRLVERREGHAPIEVVLRDGRTVRVPPGCAAADLHTVLCVLAGDAEC